MDYNSILKGTTASYLKTVNPDSPPPLSDIASKLIEEINANIEIENMALPKGSKYILLGRNGGLPPAVIADCVLYLVEVKKVTTAKETTDRDTKNYELRYYCDCGEDEGIYIPAETYLEGIIRELNYSIKRHEIKETIVAIEANAPTIERCEDPDLIPLHNGIFDYKSKKLLPFSPRLVFTAKAAVDYNPYAKNFNIHNAENGSNWNVEDWLADLHDDPEITNLIYQIIGATLRPYVPFNRMALFYGDRGCGGKGTVIALIQNILGRGRYASASMAQLAETFGLTQLLNASAILGDENDTNAYIRSLSSLKKLITHDVAVVNIKHKPSVSFVFHGMIIEAINELPRVADSTESFYRRQIYIPFEKNFIGNERKYIKEDYLKRKSVLEYVVFKVLNMPDYYDFDIPKACQLLIEDVKSENDPVRRFVQEMFPELGAWELYPSRFLYDLYRSWYVKTVSENRDACSMDVFVKQLRRLLRDGVNTDWVFSDTPIRSTGKMDNPEFLIAEYDLKDWYNSNYTGNDLYKRCDPTNNLKTLYRGIVKK